MGKRPLGTSSGQLRERKNSFLVPKRHQMKHLEVWILLSGTRGSLVLIQSPRPFISTTYKELEVSQTWLCYQYATLARPSDFSLIKF